MVILSRPQCAGPLSFPTLRAPLACSSMVLVFFFPSYGTSAPSFRTGAQLLTFSTTRRAGTWVLALTTGASKKPIRSAPPSRKFPTLPLPASRPPLSVTVATCSDDSPTLRSSPFSPGRLPPLRGLLSDGFFLFLPLAKTDLGTPLPGSTTLARWTFSRTKPWYLRYTPSPREFNCPFFLR